MHIYLVRHGITQSNKNRRYTGWSDVPLLPAGEDQAACIERYFTKHVPFYLYSSDLTRAHVTANIIGKTHGIALWRMGGS